jgi:hypothetical protein
MQANLHTTYALIKDNPQHVEKNSLSFVIAAAAAVGVSIQIQFFSS